MDNKHIMPWIHSTIEYHSVVIHLVGQFAFYSVFLWPQVKSLINFIQNTFQAPSVEKNPRLKCCNGCHFVTGCPIVSGNYAYLAFISSYLRCHGFSQVGSGIRNSGRDSGQRCMVEFLRVFLCLVIGNFSHMIKARQGLGSGCSIEPCFGKLAFRKTGMIIVNY